MDERFNVFIPEISYEHDMVVYMIGLREYVINWHRNISWLISLHLNTNYIPGERCMAAAMRLINDKC